MNKLTSLLLVIVLLICQAGTFIIIGKTNKTYFKTNTGNKVLSGLDESVNQITAASTNTPPVVINLPSQTITEGGSFALINLNNCVSDAETPDANITWTFFGPSNLAVTIVNRIASITVKNSNWNGAETITFIATDDDPTNPLSDSGSAVFTVIPINDAPVITGQNTISLKEDSSYKIKLADLKYTDPDDTSTSITLTVHAGDNYSVSGDTVTPSQDFYGTLTVPLTISDGKSSSNTYNALVSVSSINDAPVIHGQSTIYVDQNVSFPLNVGDLSVTDPDNAINELTIIVLDEIYYSVSDGNIIKPDLDYYGPLTIPVYISDGIDSSNIYYVNVDVHIFNNPPVIADIPDQIMGIGESFSSINLNDYVSDIETPKENIFWSYSGNADLTVSIINNIVTITPPSSEWTGAEAIIFRATDDNPENPKSANKEVIFSIGYINKPPVITHIPDMSANEGNSFPPIYLDNYVSDNQTPDSNITWYYAGNVNLKVTLVKHILTVSPVNDNWYGSEVLIFAAVDDDPVKLLYDEDTVTFTIKPVNDPPVVDIPDQTIVQGETFQPINLDLYTEDDESPDANIKWKYSGNTNLIINISQHIANVTVNNPIWLGFEKVTFTATDDDETFPLSTSEAVYFKIDPPQDLINYKSGEDYLVFPNPTTGDIFINSSVKDGKDILVSVLNMEGQILYSGLQNVNTEIFLDMKSYSKGIYIIKLQTKDSLRTFKINKI